MTFKNKNIWICWFQGLSDPNIPSLNKTCINNWIDLNKDFKVNLVTDKNIHEYAPEYIDIVEKYEYKYPRNYTNKSELLRVLLLDKFGGTWVDSSVYPMAPFNSFYNEVMNDTGFFTYRFFPRSKCKNMGNRETVSWFVSVDRVNHPLMIKLRDGIVNRYLSNRPYKYFTFHDVLSDLYDRDKEVKHVIDNMIQIDEKIPHSALKSWGNRLPSYLYKRPAL